MEIENSTVINEICKKNNNNTLLCNYIPKTLPGQYDHVRFVDFKRKDRRITLNSSSFIHESWTKVQTIEFSDRTGREFSCRFSRECFKGLVSLKELKIHVSSFGLDPNAFIGLPSVHTLDVSKCYRLVVQDIFNALKVKSALPALKNLIMSEVGTYLRETNNINQTDVDNILPRNITKVDFSKTHFNFVNFTACSKSLKSLESINVSYAVIADSWASDIVEKDLLSLKIVDISYLGMPTKTLHLIPGKYVLINQTVRYSEFTNFNHDLKNIFTILKLNGSGILPSVMSVWIHNCTVHIDEPLHWNVKELILRDNNLKYLEFDFVCPVYKLSSFLHLDLSNNKLEMLHPMKCLPNLEIYDLSNNYMFKMLETSPDKFEKLFASNSKLRLINLSQNHLPKIPRNIFKNNINIEKIDLSFNQLKQIHFELMSLQYLRKLDIRNNHFKVLDDDSINFLYGMPCLGQQIPVDDRCLIAMKSNPFICSTCSSKPSISLIVRLTKFIPDQHDLKCTSEAGTSLSIDEEVIREIQNICNRKTVIITSIVVTLAFLLAVCIIGLILYKRKKYLKRRRNMDTVLANLIAGEGQFEFVAFLSFSDNDYDFVQNHIINPLNENLKLIVGTDRNLICCDENFCFGFMVHDEAERCMKRASVVIFLLSDNFCRSQSCRNEFDQAILQSKPIILMLLGNVDKRLMMPTLKSMYKSNVHILWKIENGEYVLKTTWENVCSSVLEKVKV